MYCKTDSEVFRGNDADNTEEHEITRVHRYHLHPPTSLCPESHMLPSFVRSKTYPRSKLTIFLCISSLSDPALPILERLLADLSGFDAHILVEDEDINISDARGRAQSLGPNPKIRNMSRAYREAKGDIVWIIDCNVWVDKSVAARMVDLLCGFSAHGNSCKYKFVHQLPLAADLSDFPLHEEENLLLGESNGQALLQVSSSMQWKYGGILEEMFLSTSHAKFYTAISRVAIAPCIVGKSNMFRRSHLNALTNSDPARDPGIDFFSENICEDHLIGDLLWKSPVPEHARLIASREWQSQDCEGNEQANGIRWGNHGLLSGSFAIQPTMGLSVKSYLARRTRWLRVRKFTVTLATLVEPGTESLLCSALGAFGLSTWPWCNESLGVPRTWSAFCALWAFSILGWCLVDWQTWRFLQSARTIGPEDGDVPAWVKDRRKRRWTQWLLAWFGREILAFPIWLWAVAGGVTVVWRGRRFWVGMDMKVHEIDQKGTERREDMGILDARRIVHGQGSGDYVDKKVE
ncbi:MAG: hypothetical protein Q9214_000886 [Letrouitia sp. 1 TL-2023]